jgi:beta-galactosidase
VDELIGALGSVKFVILGDGKSLYQSPLMTATTTAIPISINVSNIQVLTLQVLQGNSDTTYEDYADWALAALHS